MDCFYAFLAVCIFMKYGHVCWYYVAIMVQHWKYSNDLTCNQLDYILNNRKYRKPFNGVKAFRGAESETRNEKRFLALKTGQWKEQHWTSPGNSKTITTMEQVKKKMGLKKSRIDRKTTYTKEEQRKATSGKSWLC